MKTTDQILKIKAVVMYILQSMPEGVDYIHLFKVMYFAQQEQLMQYGMPIMYDSFVARKHGPVPTLTYKVLKGVEGKLDVVSPELQDFVQSISAKSVNGHQIFVLANGAVCDKDELSVADMKTLDKWISKCRDIEPFELSDLSHDQAWKNAKNKAEKTGEDVKITLYDMAKAAGASNGMLGIIRDRQNTRRALELI